MKIYFYDAVDSTNNEAKRILLRESGDESKNKNFCVCAESQTNGRGQFDRSFFSPPGTGLYFSVCLRLNHRMSNSFITQTAAVAVCDGVEELHGIKLGIKPVNDIIYTDRKVGGILVETSANASDESYFAIFGIGLNLYKPSGGFPSELRNIAGYIYSNPIDKNLLRDKIIELLESYTANFQLSNILVKYLERVIPYERKN